MQIESFQKFEDLELFFTKFNFISTPLSKEQWNQLRNGHIWKGEFNFYDENEKIIWFEALILPKKTSEHCQNKFLLIYSDLTEKKEKEANLNHLIELTNDGLIIYNLNGEVSWYNEKSKKLLNQLKLHSNINDILSFKYEVFKNLDQKIHLKTDEKTTILSTKTQNYYFQNHSQFLVVLNDITDQTELEMKLLSQDRMANIGLLASGLAHEIGTPLGVMRGRAELVNQFKDQPNLVEKNCLIIIEQIDRVANLVKSLLNISRNQDEFHIEKISLNQLLFDLEKFISYEIIKNKIKFELNIKNFDTYVKANKGQFFQVLLNMTMNSIYFLKEKSNKESEMSALIRINVNKINENIVELIIYDNGLGIKETDLKKIFTPFYSTKPVGQGTGLGLATSEKIISSFGGQILVESEWNKFTQLTILLPASFSPIG